MLTTWADVTVRGMDAGEDSTPTAGLVSPLDRSGATTVAVAGVCCRGTDEPAIGSGDRARRGRVWRAWRGWPIGCGRGRRSSAWARWPAASWPRAEAAPRWRPPRRRRRPRARPCRLPACCRLTRCSPTRSTTPRAGCGRAPGRAWRTRTPWPASRRDASCMPPMARAPPGRPTTSGIPRSSRTPDPLTGSLTLSEASATRSGGAACRHLRMALAVRHLDPRLCHVADDHVPTTCTPRT
jgi:hypothetical protein